MIFHPRTSRPILTALIRPGALFALSFAFVVPAIAQAPAGSNWDHLKALPQHTRLHVSADKMSHTCYLLSVDDAALVCGRYTFPRAEVKSVKLTRYGVSYGVGAGIGAGVGAGVGASLASGDSLFKSDEAQIALGGAAIGAALGAVITGPADLLRGPTIYRRQ